ncbi:TonB-dependent receptor plug domain-containing protein [Ascidiimonas sp. W6]|uniref:TonB-dependent receptor plug domain-containing protein n=1 Tax=Ascidiimonas meishanensis TaxID=3128903 RepID=UPI0030ECC9F3
MNKRSISLCALTLVCTSIFAQKVQEEDQKPEELDEVVVSDSRFKLKRENSGKTVIKITQEELQQNQGKSLAELINSKSGFEINGSRSNAGQPLSYFVRGGNNRQVLILIDGVQLWDPSQIANDYDLRLVSLDQIESVEVIKGAASTLYGNGAAAAVINIKTKSAGKKSIQATINSSIGTNQSQDEKDYNAADFSNSVSVNGTLNKFTYNASFAQSYTDGLSAVVTENNERDPFSRIGSAVRLGYQFNPKLKVSLYGNHDKFNADFDNSFPIEDAANESETEQFRVGSTLNYEYGKGSITVNSAINTVDRDIISDFPSTFEAKSYIVDAFNKYTFHSSLYTIIGVNYIKNETEFDGNTNFSIVDPYANLVWVSKFGLNMNAGARLNNHSEYGTNVTYNFNPSYVIKFNEDYLKVLGSYSTSYIAPSLFQLFGTFGPNPDLEPEENTTLEGGLEYRASNFRINAIYFNRKEENFIDYVVTNFDTFEGEYRNVTDEFKVKGVEVEVATKPLENLRISANYTFTERENRVALRIPKHKANLLVGYELSKRSFASLNFQHTGSRTDTDFSTFENLELDSFSLLDLYFSHQILNDKMKVFANVANIFNEDYLEVIGFSTRGRNIRLGFSLNL